MRQKGLTLPELMIGLLLSSFIMAGLLHIYLSCKKQYQEAQTKLLQNFDLQWMSQLIADSIRKAGFTPCMKMDFLNIDDKRSGALKLSRLLAIEHSSEQSLNIKRMDAHFERLLEIQNSTQLLVTSQHVFSAQTPLFLADCIHGEIHEISEIRQTAKGQQISLKRPLTFDYPDGGFIGEWIEERWFIKKGKSALYYQKGKADELSSAIHSMKIEAYPTRLEIIFGLDKGKIWRLIAGLRNA